MPEWIIRHPYAVGALFAALTAACAFNAYRGGMAVGEARALSADAARFASEALDG